MKKHSTFLKTFVQLNSGIDLSERKTGTKVVVLLSLILVIVLSILGLIKLAIPS